jgi:flagellar FliJ protein
MSARVHREDRGLAAVARVRGVRETDSRIGLQHVLAEEAALATRLTGLSATLESAGVDAVSTTSALVAQRTALANVGVLAREARAELASAEVVSAEARTRWGADRARLAAVELLLERRALRRRTEAGRREARDADDLAAQRWSRGRSEDTP